MLVTRVFGNMMAEVPVVSTKESARRRGHARHLMRGLEDLLKKVSPSKHHLLENYPSEDAASPSAKDLPPSDGAFFERDSSYAFSIHSTALAIHLLVLITCRFFPHQLQRGDLIWSWENVAVTLTNS